MSQEQRKNNVHKVQCPQCGAMLKVNDQRKGYLCPVCEELIKVRLMKKYTLDVDEEVDVSPETATEEAMLASPAEEIGAKSSKTVETKTGVEAGVAAAAVVEDSLAAKAKELPKNKKTKKHIHDKRKKDLIFYVVMLAIPMLQFLIFYVGVNFNSILMAFQRYDDTAKKFIFLDGSNIFKNFTNVIHSLGTETVFSYALKNSLIVYVVSLIAGTGLALIFSFYIYKKFPLYGMVKVVLFTPSIISGMVLVSVFVEFVNVVIPGIVQLSSGEQMIGFITNPPTSKTFGTILFYCIWIGFGGSILLYVGAMNNISESVSEACNLDGANLFQEMIHIVLPLIYPTFVTFMVVGVGGIFTGQMALYAFFGPGADETIQTFGYYLFKTTKAAGESDYPYLATMGLLMTLVVAPLTFLVKWALEKLGPSVE